MTVVPARTGDPSSRKRLTPGAADAFVGDSLFARVARVVCGANCLPRKELYESWETARRVRKRMKGGARVLDMCGGHGLLAHLLLLIDDTTPEAIIVDTSKPLSADILSTAMVAMWPRLAGRVHYLERSIEDVEVTRDDVIVSAHACGGLTDVVLDKAIAVSARVAVLPCCHQQDPAHALAAWLPLDVAIDVDRVHRLQRAGYAVRTQQIPATITPKNRLILALP